MNAERVRQYAADPLAFLADLVIPSVHGPQRFADCWADFQREWFAAVAPSLAAVARGERPPVGRFWVERTKGASKDSDCAACLLWLLAFTRRPLDSQVGAADQDQADELRKAARDILRLNNWLAARVAIQNWRILCSATESECEIIAADVAGSHGARPDVLIVNELSHVTKQEFAENLMDNATKVPHGLVVVATNAGFINTWQMKWRELAADSPRWSFHRFAQPAPWLDDAEIAEAQRRNSSSRFRRLFFGQWASGAGDALDSDSIEAAVTLDGPSDSAPNREFGYAAGLDLSTKRDHSALVVLGADWQRRRIRLASCESWSPSIGGQVDLQAVQDAALSAAQRFDCPIFFDPHQAHLMAQQLAERGVRCVEVPFVGQQLNRMASTLLQVFREGRIDLYRDPELLDDLSRLCIVERNWGYKLEAPHDREKGHADRAFALAIALPAALDFAMEYSGESFSEPTFSTVYDDTELHPNVLPWECR